MGNALLKPGSRIAISLVKRNRSSMKIISEHEENKGSGGWYWRFGVVK